MKTAKLLLPLMILAACGCKQPDVDPTPTPTPTPTPVPVDPVQPESPVVELTLRTETVNQMSCTFDANTNEYTFTTSGTDPFIFTTRLTKALPDSCCILSFSYTSTLAVDDFQLYYCDPLAENRSGHFGGMDKTSGYKQMSCNLTEDRKNFAWGKSGDYLRVDFGHTDKNTLHIKDLQIRPMNKAEREAYEKAQDQARSKEERAAAIEAYLKKNYASSVQSVQVSANEITISGTTSGTGCALAEITMDQDFITMTSFPEKTDLPAGAFNVTLPRRATSGGLTRDRALSRWAVVKGNTPDSHARYADEITVSGGPAEMKPQTKKGLGNILNNTLQTSDLDELGITSGTVNIVLNALISDTQGSGFNQTFTYFGKTYYINSSQVNNLDKIFKACASRKIVTEAILLVQPTGTLKHPENDGGTYSMPNLTTPAGVHLYAAAIDYLAARYNGGANGRINHWILHNEVDCQKQWTNMGDQPEMVFMDAYVKSMRICSLIARQYDENAAALISLTHAWNKAEGQYAPKKMLEELNLFSKAEGDFRWGIAYHPYPQDLFQPEFWKVDTKATWSRNSDYCTFKNLEVIHDWVISPENYYKGTQKRLLFLSENGTNSPSYAEADLARQAAGACWMWKKVSALSGIDAVQWHNWRDNQGEGGLRIGLRQFPESPYNNEKKPVWDVYKAAGTASEDAVFAPYLTVIGIRSWTEIFQNIN